MNDKEWNPIRKRNVIILMGLSVLLIALLIEPSPSALFTSRFGLLKIALAGVSGLVFAIGIAQIAEQALKSPVEPWYARPLGLGLLAIVILVALSGWRFFGHHLKRDTTISPEEEIAYLCGLVGWTLIWTVLIEWVSCEKGK